MCGSGRRDYKTNSKSNIDISLPSSFILLFQTSIAILCNKIKQLTLGQIDLTVVADSDQINGNK